MSQNQRSFFDPAAKSAELHALDQYCASPGFIPLVAWQTDKMDILCVNRPADEPMEPVMCVIVGRISRDKTYLAPHGNFNPKFAKPEKGAKTAKMQLSLERPDDPILGKDFDDGYINARTVQGQVAVTPTIQHFLNEENHTMRFNHFIWEEKNAENTDAASNAVTSGYTVNAKCTPFWNATKATHHCRPPSVYDINENLITNLAIIAAKLPGSTVELTFILQHWHIVANATRPASDTFSAIIQSISILREAVPFLRSPFKPSPKKPKASAQTPSGSRRLPPVAQPTFAPIPSTSKPPGTDITESTDSSVESPSRDLALAASVPSPVVIATEAHATCSTAVAALCATAVPVVQGKEEMEDNAEVSREQADVKNPDDPEAPVTSSSGHSVVSNAEVEHTPSKKRSLEDNEHAATTTKKDLKGKQKQVQDDEMEEGQVGGEVSGEMEAEAVPKKKSRRA